MIPEHKLSEQTIVRMRRGIRFILSEPRRFNMLFPVIPTDYYGSSSKLFGVLEEPPCGTACCYAGAIYLQATRANVQHHRIVAWGHIRTFAINHLGIDSFEADKLFHVNLWPKHFQILYDNSVTAIERAYVAAARIEHFIATGE